MVIKKEYGYFFCWLCTFHKLSMKYKFRIYETICKICIADTIIKKGLE